MTIIHLKCFYWFLLYIMDKVELNKFIKNLPNTMIDNPLALIYSTFSS